MNDQSLSNIIVNWKIYEYINVTAPNSSNVISKMIDLQEDKISMIDFLKKFEKKIINTPSILIELDGKT
jgi:hypothetical protein